MSDDDAVAPVGALADIRAYAAAKKNTTTPPPTPPAAPRNSSSPSTLPYVTAAFTREIEELRTARETTRNGKLNEAAYNLGGLVNAGLLNRQTVYDALYSAGTECGLGHNEMVGPRGTTGTINSGLNSAKIRVIPDRATSPKPRYPTNPHADQTPTPNLENAEETDQPLEDEYLHPWLPIDLTDVLNGDWEPPKPTVGQRDDGVGLFYPGRVHTVASEPEGGKTWFALAAAATELSRGNAIIYIDFEDDESGVTSRLRALGITPEVILAQFGYINPNQPITQSINRNDLATAIAVLKPTLAIIDGVTEAMALHGMELKDNTDVATFGVILPRWIADQGPAVVLLDHVTKDPETRGKWALGGQHKLAGLNGAAYILDNRKPFGIAMTGISGIKIAKDRPGQLRRHAHPTGGGLHWFGDLVLESISDTVAYTRIEPVKRRDGAIVFRPTLIMKKVSDILAVQPGLTKNSIISAAGTRKDHTAHAVELLINEGFVEVKKHGQGHHHTLIKPFEEEPPVGGRWGESDD